MPFDLRFYQPAFSRIGRHLQLGMKLSADRSILLHAQLRASVPADDNPSPGAPDQLAVPAPRRRSPE
jgi:hypothetical protein